MKIIHTSDWHLGRRFGPVSLEADQQAFADWFVDLVADQHADLVVIAGDLYDRAIAPTSAIGLFENTVRRLLDTGTVVAAISGNHDGAPRVAPYSDLMDRSGFYLRGGYQRVGTVIRHEFADGPLDLVLIPYLDPLSAPDDFGATAAHPEYADDAELLERRHRRTHQSVLEDTIASVTPLLTAPRSLAVAHAFVTGAQTSESERPLIVGGTGEVPISLFEQFSYTALGHLHRPQSVADPHIRYSGTPLAYSFSEEHPKSVVILEMDPTGAVEASTEAVGVGRGVRTITGDMSELLEPGFAPDAGDCFVRAVVTDRDTVLDAKSRLAELYPHIVEVRLQPSGEHPDADGPSTETPSLGAFEATGEFWEAAEGTPAPPEIARLLADAVTHATRVQEGAL